MRGVVNAGVVETAEEDGRRSAMATNPIDVPRHYYSLEEYFALERTSDARFEYWDGDIVCMSGGRRAHGMISSNVHGALIMALRGG
jgi:hypothetical protein